MQAPATAPTGGYTRAFWTANVVELLERGAWYGVFVAITLYLSRILGFSDVEAATVSGCFSAGLYLLPCSPAHGPIASAFVPRCSLRSRC